MRLPKLFGRTTGGPARDIREIVQGFESLGDNCEFGLVQRYVGAEPLGLFRFSNTSDIDGLIHALDTDFEHYGTGDDLLIAGDPSEGLVCRSRRYGFGYAVSDVPPSMSVEAVLARETRKIAYLKRRLLEDLAGGDKILVRKNTPGESPERIQALVRALRRHGPSRLLHVRETGDPHGDFPRAATVRWCDEVVMERFVPRFAPRERAYEIDLESWLTVCRDADALARGLGARKPPSGSKNLLGKAFSGTTEHVLGSGHGLGVDNLEVFTMARATNTLAPDTVHAFSAWIWLPPGFAGDRVDAAIANYRLGWRTADLSLTGTWQRIWIGAMLPRDVHGIDVGLLVGGPRGQRFWSTGWCLEEGPVPAPAKPPSRPPPSRQPPSIRMGPGSGA